MKRIGMSSKRKLPSDSGSGHKSALEGLTHAAQQTLLHDLYDRLRAIDPQGAAEALAAALQRKTTRQDLNRSLDGRWLVKHGAGRIVGYVCFIAKDNRIMIDDFDINDMCAEDVSCRDHREELVFNIRSKMCSEYVEACFTVFVDTDENEVRGTSMSQATSIIGTTTSRPTA